jgi:hypothetical protein
MREEAMHVASRSATVAGSVALFVIICASGGGAPAAAASPSPSGADSSALRSTSGASSRPHATSSSSALPSSATYADPQGDVWRTTNSDQTQEEATPAPGVVATDVTRTRFQHLHSTVRLRTTFVDLERPAPPDAPVSDGSIRYYQVFVYVATSDGNGQYVTMEIGHKGAGKVTMHPFAGGRTPCATSHAIDYGKDWIRVGFPRSCLGDPAWVRLGAVVVAGVATDVTCFEDAVTDGFEYATKSFSAVRLSARLHQP